MVFGRIEPCGACHRTRPVGGDLLCEACRSAGRAVRPEPPLWVKVVLLVISTPLLALAYFGFARFILTARLAW